MADATNTNPDDANLLGKVLTLGKEVLRTLNPDWKAPDLIHPGAKIYVDAVDMLDHIKPGDQIAVLSSAEYWHHGIYVGKQVIEGAKIRAVVDAWGSNKEASTISVRSYQKFTSGAKGYAKIEYKEEEALSHKECLKTALGLVEAARNAGFEYNALRNNCDHVATGCRTGRYDTGYETAHAHVTSILGEVQIAPPPIHRRGFKW